METSYQIRSAYRDDWQDAMGPRKILVPHDLSRLVLVEDPLFLLIDIQSHTAELPCYQAV